MDIKLDFRNRCRARHAPTVVIFQVDDDDPEALAVAWKVIRNCAPGWHHPFVFSTEPEINVSDRYGNHLPRHAAANGMVFDLTPLVCGRRLARDRMPGKSDEIVLRNRLAHGGVDVNLYSNGLLLARKSQVGPGRQATFRFGSTLCIGVVHHQAEGRTFAPDAVLTECVDVPLRGIASADLVLELDDERGGDGPAYRFIVENVVRA
ncbi:hypothetical protein [Massilia sp. Root335]|uniref:hypothetical protein n=1 Tax=Massilia sp. Root335 TaxID=1736517 RepID=UPI0006F95691|nr:hypothetical protein [Massilia sp. Root335]KQV46355.1 hypothetical protein ASC93_14585 [Massilia sp. Root335]